MHVSAIIAAGGYGRRMGAAIPKQWLELGGRSILQHCVEAFLRHPQVAEVVVALPPPLGEPPPWLQALRLVAGGERRQDSVANAFDAVSEGSEVVLVHDGARPFVTEAVISRVIDAAARHGGAIAALPANETVKRVRAAGETLEIEETLPREQIYLAQTPQAFRRDVLRDAIALGRRGVAATDEAMLAERAGHPVRIVAGDPANVKITTAADLESARRREAPGPAVAASGRIGIGYDLHRLVEGRPLILGGVHIESDRGALGHSDADVICHAVTDALLGAARAGDIGQLFPDTDPRWKNASSIDLLQQAAALVHDRGLAVANVDVVVVLERPKLGPFRSAIEHCLADALRIDPGSVSVKAKTNEGMDAIGRGEAIAAHAVALLRSSILRTREP